MLDAKMAELAKEVVEGWDDEVSSDSAYIFQFARLLFFHLSLGVTIEAGRGKDE